jgi:SAM-dependent methyltransferase
LYSRLSIAKWDERYRAGERGSAKPSAAVIEAAADAPPGRALDLACGAGRNALFLAKNGWRVTAIDGSSEAIAIASHRAERLGLVIDFRRIDLEEQLPLPYASHTFELVCIVLYLQPALFEEAKRLVAPGGRIVVVTRTEGSFALGLPELRAHFSGMQIIAARVRRGRNGEETAELIASVPQQKVLNA